MCTDVILRAHRSVYAPDRSWSGWGPFSRFLLLGEAIFIESDLGDMPTETAAACEYARGSLFGPDSIKQVKTERGAGLGYRHLGSVF